ncbi:hypothetical protein [Sphingobacterium sp. LRF_L2]|uniref:hypothetical protein n=1 Tax=Sphingobacterium sp. LRF_L2 TaxID=3369421 RepID=UPI003F6231DB
MKTSSKYSIGLGLLVFIVPLLILSFSVTKGRVNEVEYRKAIEEEASNSEAADFYLKTIRVKPFKKLQIVGTGEESSINVYIVKSEQYALKIARDGEMSKDVTVDESGLLRIDAPVNTLNYGQNNLYIFAPKIDELDLSNVTIGDVDIHTDSLIVRADRLKGFNFSPGSTMDKLHLNIRNSILNMENKERADAASQWQVPDLFLELDSATCSLINPHFNRLKIKSENSSVNFVDKNKENKEHINDLEIYTKGSNDLRLDVVDIHKLSGSLSEETSIDLPLKRVIRLVRKK